MALYPHCFYINNSGQIKTIDFYSCIEKDNCMLPRSQLEGIIGKDSTGRFDASTVDGIIDFSVFFEKTVLVHLAQNWPTNPFPNFYTRLKHE